MTKLKVKNKRPNLKPGETNLAPRFKIFNECPLNIVTINFHTNSRTCNRFLIMYTHTYVHKAYTHGSLRRNYRKAIDQRSRISLFRTYQRRGNGKKRRTRHHGAAIAMQR